MMKHLLCLLATILLAFPPEGVALEWLNDLDIASATAGGQDKTVLIGFFGSDWCKACKRLDREVLSTPEFMSYASNRLVCVSIDFPRKTRLPDDVLARNRELKARFQVTGYPSVFLLDRQGRPFARVRYKTGGPVSFIRTIEHHIANNQDRRVAPVPAEQEGESAPDPSGEAP